MGKSSLILQLCEGRFNASCASTLGLDFSTKMLAVGDEVVVFQLWDTAGQERSECYPLNNVSALYIFP